MAVRSASEAREVVLEYKENRGDDTMSARTYVVTLSLLIMGGILAAAGVASVTYNMTPNIWWIVAYFALAIPGCFLGMSQNPVLALCGYLMIILPTGAILGPYIHLFTMESVVRVAIITLGVTAALGVAGAIWPKSVEHWGGILLAGLFFVILADLSHIVMMMFGLKPTTSMAIVDWGAAALFCAFIFYDMNQAMRMPFNFTNAVFNAINMYLNVLNLFVRLLAQMGSKAVEVAPAIGEAVGDAAGAVASGVADAL